MLAGFFPLDEATGSDWRFERVKMAAQHQISTVRTIYGFYERKCELSLQVVDLIDGMLGVNPQKRLKQVDVLQNMWITDPKGCVGGDDMDAHAYDEAPRYRGAMPNIPPGGFEDPMGPVYRGATALPKNAAPPMLGKQNAASCLKAAPPS